MMIFMIIQNLGNLSYWTLYFGVIYIIYKLHIYIYSVFFVFFLINMGFK